MSIGWDVSELLAERDELRRKLALRDKQLAEADRQSEREVDDLTGRVLHLTQHVRARDKDIEKATRERIDLETKLRIARETVDRLEYESMELATRLNFAQRSAIASSQTTYIALTRLQAALDVVETSRRCLEGRTLNGIKETGLLRLYENIVAYDATIAKRAST